MAEDIKSALHDATPSWNGFNYQGKVGLYICLNIIVDKLNEVGIDSEEFSLLLSNYSIEYEWIEDFSIKKNDQYVSLHQVKHKAGTGFSDHISAIVTILNRKLGRLSETDFIKYIDLDIDYTACNTPEEKNAKKHQEVNSKFELMQQAGYLDDENKLTDRWQEIELAIDGINSDDLTKLLEEFDYFSKRTFENSEVYFHTAEAVSAPNKDIHSYQGMPEHHHESVNELRSLSSLNIYLGFDAQAKYGLVLSDDDLINKINQLITQVLEFTLPGEEFSDADISNYLAALCQVIDRHIASRHNDIRLGKNPGVGFEEQRNSLAFSELFCPLNELVQEQNEVYWERFCALSFEDAYKHESERLDFLVANSQNVAQCEKRKRNIDTYRSLLLKKYKYSEILLMLNPHLIKTNPIINFYNELSSKELLVRVFLSFIRDIEGDADDFIIKADNSHAFHPSVISVEADEECEQAYELSKVRHQISENDQLISLFNATHLVIKASNGHDLTNEKVELLTIVEKIDAELTNDAEHSTSNVLSVKFESIEDALGKIR